MTFTDYQKLRIAADGLIEELQPVIPAHLSFTNDLIVAFDGDGKRIGEVQWSGGSAGAGLVWDPKHRCDRTIHISGINAAA